MRVTREIAFPRKKNGLVERLENVEKTNSVEIGTSLKIEFQIKTSDSTKVLSDEWQLNTREVVELKMVTWSCGLTPVLTGL